MSDVVTPTTALTLDALKADGQIAVLKGGSSAEREISLKSGAAVAAALRSAGFDVVEIDTQVNAVSSIVQAKPDFCFIALHGGDGENGSIQALLELLGIPYSGSGVLGSALALDKVRSKQVWQAQGLLTPAYRVVSSTGTEDVSEMLNALGGTVFVKPASEGSSFGMAVADTEAKLRTAIVNAQQYQPDVLIEQCIEGPEYTVPILVGQELPSICIQTSRSFYDFEAKYRDDDTQFLIPSGLNEAEEGELQALCKQAFDALGCSAWGRIDVMRASSTGRFYLLEANTVPGLTDHSLMPMAAKAAGKSFAELLTDIIALGLAGS